MNKQQLQSAATWRTNKAFQDRIEELERALLEARRVLGNMLEDGDDADRRQAMDVWDKLFRLTTTGGNDET
jgi:hypothetical protein